MLIVVRKGTAKIANPAVIIVLLFFAVSGKLVLAEPRPSVTVRFVFPGGSAKEVALTYPEAADILREKLPYTVDFWVRAALRKLHLRYKTEQQQGKVACDKIVQIEDVANSTGQEWVYFVDGMLSPYCINNQIAANIKTIRYEFLRPRKKR